MPSSPDPLVAGRDLLGERGEGSRPLLPKLVAPCFLLPGLGPDFGLLRFQHGAALVKGAFAIGELGFQFVGLLHQGEDPVLDRPDPGLRAGDLFLESLVFLVGAGPEQLVPGLVHVPLGLFEFGLGVPALGRGLAEFLLHRRDVRSRRLDLRVDCLESARHAREFAIAGREPYIEALNFPERRQLGKHGLKRPREERCGQLGAGGGATRARC